jgi:hypothetical protein
MQSSPMLGSLRDVEGVIGSFVIDSEGALAAGDLPSIFYPELFAEVGPRLLRLREGAEATGDDPQGFVMRFADYKLHIRCFPAGLLCVLSEPKVNAAALRLALTLVARRLPIAASSVEASASSPAPPPTLPSSSPPPPVAVLEASGPVAHRPTSYYRGRPVAGDK